MKYVAFLRGIKVGGNRLVKMENLKNWFEDMGYLNVKTLLNSGNVIFEVPKGGEIEAMTIEERLAKKLGYTVSVIVRSMEYLKELVHKTPFKDIKVTKDTRLYVTFLKETEIFNCVDISQKGTTDLMTEIDKQYGKVSTTRNWNTVCKIAVL